MIRLTPIGISLVAVWVLFGPQDRAKIPNDPLFSEQCSFRPPGRCTGLRSSRLRERVPVDVAAGAALNMPAAWALATGSKSVVVAVLDDGFFYRHEDIEPNLWRNPGESGLDSLGQPRETNGIDDDGDGYIDDVIGWDFAFDDPDPDPYVFDGMDRTRIQPYWHSLHALGIIGAKGNNAVGITGINWDVSLMLLKIGAQGTRRGEVDSLRAQRASRAIRFAADHGARVLNWSGFIDDTRPETVASLRDAIRYAAAHNVLVVVGAGNDRRDIDRDENCMYPQCIDEPNMLRVAQLAANGRLYEYDVGGQRRGSNYGARRVELAAMGEHFTTGLRDNNSTYEISNGTSNAGPVVAGVAALVLSARPALTTAELKKDLLESATILPALQWKVQGARAINPFGAVQRALRP